MIYLDSAATSLQKPPEVANAMTWTVKNLASPGRGGYPAAARAARLVFRCREVAAELFRVPSPEQVVFTSSATHGLNIAIRSLVKPGGRVVISGYEHNAVTRTLQAIPGLEVVIAKAPLFGWEQMVDAFCAALEEPADAVICTHVSNVFGYILPIEDIAVLCRTKGVPLVVDASQSVGSLPVDFGQLGAAFIAMPGHKGLLGPQGTGVLLCGEQTEPLLYGGTGSESLNQSMPDFLPDRLEPGTHNMPGIAGLYEGLRYLRRRGIDTIFGHEQMLIRRMGEGLAGIPGVTTYRDPSGNAQAGVLSFQIAGWDCEMLCDAFAQRGIALRGGLHCAPLAHRTAGTADLGTVRASVSAFSRVWEIDRFLGVADKLAARYRP